jgi:hypothetical protein
MEDMLLIERQYLEVSKNVFRRAPSEQVTMVFDVCAPVLAVDSSETGYGIVPLQLDEDNRIHRTGKIIEEIWRDDYVGRHIFLLEMRVLTLAVKDFFTSHPLATQLLVVSDNSGVVWSIRNGFCTNAVAMNMIETIRPWLGFIRMISVVSAHNVADCPSRRFASKNPYADFDERLEHTRKAIVEDFKGRRSGKSVIEEPAFGGIRHEAPTGAPSGKWTDGVEVQGDDALHLLWSDCLVERL